MAGYYGQGGGFRSQKPREEVDPMSSMGNMGDIMLVFACGLMVALVVAWNVDLSKFTQVQMGEEIDQNAVTQASNQPGGEGNSYLEMGKVYQDPETGKYYLVEDTAQGSTSNATATDTGESGGQ